MTPSLVDIILVVVIVIIVGLACLYIYKTKKAGAVCIGCPYAKECAKRGSSDKSKNNCENSKNSCCH